MKENPGDPFVHVNLFNERALAKRKVGFPFPSPSINSDTDENRTRSQKSNSRQCPISTSSTALHGTGNINMNDGPPVDGP